MDAVGTGVIPHAGCATGHSLAVGATSRCIRGAHDRGGCVDIGGNGMKRIATMGLVGLTAIQLALAPGLSAYAADQAVLKDGTRMYLSLDELVTSARGGDDVGTIVRCRVWRDVEDNGVVFIKAGTPATCRVEKVSRRNIGGFEGKVAVAGVETKAVDGQMVTLAGGYNKEGNGHKALVLTVGILLLWPVLFVPGGNAELPPGTVFDVGTVNDLKLAEASVKDAPKVVDLRALGTGFSAEFMLDDFIAQPKHDVFRIKVAKDGELPKQLVIDNVNGKPVDPIPLTLKNATTKDGEATGTAEVNAKLVAKYFARGINRFEVSYKDGDQRQATEVVMNVQM
jgi:hypothetical protein